MPLLRPVPLWLLPLALVALPASAMPIVTTLTLGNDAPGFNPGDVPSLAQLTAAQGGQPAPFDQGKGNEVLGPDFSATWTHDLPIFLGTVTAASITIGIADHDSAASGSQVALFQVGAEDLTSALDSAFEAAGGAADGAYAIYTVPLPGSLLSGLSGSMLTVQLQLMGPGLQTPVVPPGPAVEVEWNGAFLLYSTLEITSNVPEPAAGLLVVGAASVLASARPRRRFGS